MHTNERLLVNLLFGNFYLRQVNGMNGGDNVFVRCVSACLCLCACVCVCVCAQRTGQSDQFKTVKATDFKYDVRFRRSLDMTAQNFFERWRRQGHVTP